MIGDVIDERFRVDREAAAGGMGRIFQAHDLHAGRTVALKVIVGSNADSAERFERESVLLAELRHPGIVEYVAHGKLASGAPYLVMEWLEGVDLASYLPRWQPAVLDPTSPAGNAATMATGIGRGVGLPIADVLVLARRLTATLASIHARGIIHRDLKPSNLFLPGGEIARVKLIDFGTARDVLHARPLTRQGDVVGTPFYMAPEQARGADIGPPADVWALGCVLYECLTGQPPFAAKHPLAAMIRVMVDEPTAVELVRPSVPPSLAALVRAMLTKEPRARPISGDGLARLLAAVEGAGVVPVHDARASSSAEAVGVASTLVPAMRGERRVRALLFGRLGDPRSNDLAALRKLAAPYGAKIEEIADGAGSLLISHPGSESPSDQASRGALLALALRAAAPGLALALATGRTVDGDVARIGAIVDQAVAKLAEAHPGEIHLDRVTAGLLEGRFEIDDSAGRCLLIKRRSAEATRTLLGKASPWVGRRRELDGLLATFDECVENSIARAVLVTATPGVGKSRLGSELLRALAARGDDLEILVGHGDAFSAGSPFVMIAPAIRRSAGILDGEPLEARRAKLRARLSWSVAPDAVDRVSAFLGELIGVPFPDDDLESLRAARSDSMLLGELMRGAFLDWLTAECSLRPVLFVLEDLHWGDAPSVSFLDAALRVLHARPFMVLALARPEIHGAFPRLWHSRELEELRLHALPPKACGELVRSALGANVPDAEVDAMVARSQGNAFFLEEIVRAAADGSVDGLPDSVIGMVQTRLYALDLEARRVLRAASVFGEVFWLGGVRALVGAFDGAFDVEEWLAELVRLEVVNLQPSSRIPGEREYRFRHALLRDGAYEMLIEDDRTTGHRVAGEWLEANGESDALVLAGHFERGHDRERAIVWLTRAAGEALEASDLTAVIERAERAIASGARGAALGAVRGLQAIAAFWFGRYRDSVTFGEEAADLLPEGSDASFQAISSAMVSNARLGEHDRFDRLLERTERTPGSGSARLICLSRGAYQLILGGRVEWADRILSDLEPIVAASTELNALTIAHINDARAIRAGMRGELRTMHHHATAIVDAYRRAGDVNNACVSYSTLAFVINRLGDLTAAETMYEEMLREATQLGSRQSILMARLGLGMVYSFQRGKGSQGHALLQECATTFRDAMHPRFEGWALCFLADLEHRTGDLVASLEHAALAVEKLAGTPGMQGWALALHGRALLAHGQPDAALERVALSEALLHRLGGFPWGDSLPWLVRAEAFAAGGDQIAAVAAITSARDRLVSYATTLEDTPWSKTYLDLPDAARTLALAAEWIAR